MHLQPNSDGIVEFRLAGEWNIRLPWGVMRVGVRIMPPKSQHFLLDFDANGWASPTGSPLQHLVPPMMLFQSAITILVIIERTKKGNGYVWFLNVVHYSFHGSCSHELLERRNLSKDQVPAEKLFNPGLRWDEISTIKDRRSVNQLRNNEQSQTVERLLLEKPQ
jgi:hypothetical protein